MTLSNKSSEELNEQELDTVSGGANKIPLRITGRGQTWTYKQADGSVLSVSTPADYSGEVNLDIVVK